MVAVMGVIASYGVAGPISLAYAASVVGSDFEIDTNANLTVDGGGSAIDWLDGSSMRAGVMVKHDTPSGSADDSFTQGTKEDSAVPTIAFGSIPPNKSDLKDFGAYVEKHATANFVNVFWTRVQDPQGTTNMDFEFNQSMNTANDPSSGPQIIPVRTVGDILITYDLANGGTKAIISKRTWDGSSWGTATVFDDTQALGTINTTAITPANSDGLNGGSGLSARTFGEASINLDVFIGNQQGSCTTFGSVYVKSRSSDSFSAELKDFIAPEPVSISNCGTVKIHKTDDQGHALAGAGFTLYTDAAPTGSPYDPNADNVAVSGVGSPCTTDNNGDCTFTNVKKGYYWVVETTVPAGHDGAAPQPVHITAGDQEVDLTFVDPIQYGTITVVKNAVPDDPQDFTFTLDGNGFSLDDDPSDATLPNSRDFTVVVGSHTVAETDVPAGWVLTNLTCDGVSKGSNASTTVTVTSGQHVTCTYTDTFTKLSPHLATQVAVAQANTSWNDGASLTGDGVHPVTGTVDFFVCGPTASPANCSSSSTQVGGDATVSGSGSSYHATTTAPFAPTFAGNYCFRAEFHSTSAFYADDSHTNTGSECFLKQNANLTVTKTAVAAFGRAYHWTIAKDADQTHIDIAQGGTATAHYTVTVANTHTDDAWTVTGVVTVHNPNNVAFTGVNVTDAIDNKTPGTCTVTGGANATVPPNGTATFPYSCTYSSAPNPAAGTNTATATWDGVALFTTGSSASGTANVDFSQVSPSTTDERVTVTDSVVGTLGTVNALTDPNPTTFTYSVSRAGVPGTCTSYDNTATFTTNDTQATGSDSKTVTLCVGVNLSVTKSVTATFDRDHPWSITKDVDQTHVDIADGGSATFHYTVHVAPGAPVDTNFQMSGTITVSNPNDWEAITATVTDTPSVGGGVTCTVNGGTNVSIPASGHVNLPYSCQFANGAQNGSNTATATWNATAVHTPSGTASGSSAATFAIANETHATITVTDDKTDPQNPVTLGTRNAADGPHDFTYSLTKSGVAGTCTSYTNTARIVETEQSASKTVTVCVGLNLTVQKTALATDHRTYLWDISKDVDATRVNIDENGTAHFTYTVKAIPSGLTKDGWTVTGKVTVTNPNNWEDITATVTDDPGVGGGPNCTVGSGTPVLVPAGQSVDLSYSCTFATQPGDGTNTATATWDSAAASTPSGTATGTASLVFVPASEDNRSITVVDDKTDPQNPVTLGDAAWNADGTPIVFTYTLDKQGVAGTCTDYTNTASIQQTQQSASRTVTVCVGSGLTTQMSGAASFDRTFNWLIDKTVDQTSITINNGQTATFNYTVTVTPNGIVDSGYVMGGSVTVTNPNDWEDVTADVSVASDVGGGVDCPVTGGTGAVIPASGSLTLTYACAFTGAPAATGTNTASVTWDSESATTATSSSAASVPITFDVASETNRTITVTDDKTDPANPVTLGTATYDDGVKAFTYSLTKAGVASTCTDYTNVATIVETQQSDTQVVTLCDTFTGGGGTVTPPTGGGGLPFTGDALGLLARTAAALLAAGLALLLVSRRRRRA